MPLAEPIVVLFAVLAIATPFITLALLGKYKKLRQNLDQLAEENSRQHASFQREVADLKRQLTAAVHPAAPVVGDSTQRPAAPGTSALKETTVSTPRVDLPVPVKLPVPMSFPSSEKKPEQQPVQKPPEPAPIVPTPAPIAPAGGPAQKLPASPAPAEPKPVLPVAAKSPAEIKPSAPLGPASRSLVPAACAAHSRAYAARAGGDSSCCGCARFRTTSDLCVSRARAKTDVSAAHEDRLCY
jgi:hypothetical protein